MKISGFILSKAQEEIILRLYKIFKNKYPNVVIDNREDIIGIGEMNKHLLCYFGLTNNTFFVKFKNGDKYNLTENPKANMSSSIYHTIILFTNNDYSIQNSSNNVKNKPMIDDRESSTNKTNECNMSTIDLITNRIYIHQTFILEYYCKSYLENISNENDKIQFNVCSTRLQNAFTRKGILCINDLKQYPVNSLIDIPNFGTTTFNELVNYISLFVDKSYNQKLALYKLDSIKSLNSKIRDAVYLYTISLCNIDNELEDVGFSSCSIRLKNILSVYGIKCIKDLKKYNVLDVLDFHNMNNNLFCNLACYLYNLIQKMQLSDKQPHLVNDELELKKTFIEKIRNEKLVFDWDLALNAYLKNMTAYAKIYDELIDGIDKFARISLTVRNKHVVFARLGIRQDACTLNSIGLHYGISKGSISRIVDKFYSKYDVNTFVNKTLIDMEYTNCVLIDKINKLCLSGFTYYIYKTCCKEFTKFFITCILRQELNMDYITNNLIKISAQKTNNYKVTIEANKKKLNSINKKNSDNIYQYISFDSYKKYIKEEDFNKLNALMVINSGNKKMNIKSSSGQNYHCKDDNEKLLIRKILNKKLFKSIKLRAIQIPNNDKFYYPTLACLTDKNEMVILDVLDKSTSSEQDISIQKKLVKDYCGKHGYGYMFIDEFPNTLIK